MSKFIGDKQTQREVAETLAKMCSQIVLLRTGLDNMSPLVNDSATQGTLDRSIESCNHMLNELQPLYKGMAREALS